MKKSLIPIFVLFHSCLLAQLDLSMVWHDTAESNKSNSSSIITMAHDGSDNLYVLFSYVGEIGLSDSTVFTESIFWLGRYYIVKYSAYGELLWAKPVFHNGLMYPKALGVHANGDVYICGNMNGLVNVGTAFSTNYVGTDDISQWFVMKLSPEGEYQWIIGADGHPDAEPTANQIVIGESHIYLAGTYKNFVDLDPGEDLVFTDAMIAYETNLFIIKLTIEGAYVWSRASKEGTFCVTNDLEVDEETGQIGLSAKCYYSLDADFTSGTFPLPEGSDYNGFISRYSLDGQFLSCYPLSNQHPLSQPINLAFDNSGNMLISSQVSFSTTLLVNGLETTISPGGVDGLILKVSSIGSLEWYHTFSGENYEIIEGLISFGNETYISGRITSETVYWDNVEMTESFEPGNEAYLFLLDEDGIPIGSESFGGGGEENINKMTYSGSMLTLGIEFDSAITNCPWVTMEEPGNIDNIFISFRKVLRAEAFEDTSLSVFPNPSSGNLVVNLPISHKDVDIELHDLSGRCVSKRHYLEASPLSLSFPDLHGAFVLQVKTKDFLYTQKIVFE